MAVLLLFLVPAGAVEEGQSELFRGMNLVDLPLPVAGTAVADKSAELDLRYIVNVTKDGFIKYKGNDYTLGELKQLMNRLKRFYGKYRDFGTPPNTIKASELYVLVRADKDAPWIYVAWIMTILAEEKIYKLQLAVKRVADRSYTQAEAAGLGATWKDQPPPQPLDLEAKLPAFLRTRKDAWPRTAVRIVGKDIVERNWKRRPGERWRIRVPASVAYEVGEESATSIPELGKWLSRATAAARKYEPNNVARIGISADPGVPYKYVVAVIDQARQARVQWVWDGRIVVIPDKRARNAPRLPYPDTLRDPLERKALHECDHLYDVVAAWQRVTKATFPPASLAELEKPIQDHGEPFVKVGADPWGRAYRIEVEADKFRIVSNGRDGKPGTDDDIAFPEIPLQGR